MAIGRESMPLPHGADYEPVREVVMGLPINAIPALLTRCLEVPGCTLRDQRRASAEHV